MLPIEPKILFIALVLIGIGIAMGYYLENVLEPESLLQKCISEKNLLKNEVKDCYIQIGTLVNE